MSDTDFNLFLCVFLWRNAPDAPDESYDRLCDAVQRRLSDDQWHEIEFLFEI